MLWYVIQTYTGREEKLVEMIRRIIPAELYGECFVVYHEQLRSRKHENQVHVERIFPGYAFITSREPERLFLSLKSVPAMSKMMAVGEFYFTPLESSEAEFLGRILDADHVVRLSYVATDGHDHVSYISGPLSLCGGRIQDYHFRKRCAAVRLKIAGQTKVVRLGIILNDDIRREVAYGKIEAPIQTPEKYRIADNRAADDRTAGMPAGPPDLQTGDTVIVIDGAFEGMPATVRQVKKNTVKIGVHLFGQDMAAEVPAECVRKTA